MAKRGLTYLFLAAVLMLSVAVFAPFAEAAGEPAQCGINKFNISTVSTTLSGTAQVLNWTVTIATSNSSIFNVTNVTIFRNDTRVILCQNLSLRINSTTTNNCTFDSTGQTDISNLVLQAEAYEANGTGGVERCTNISFLNGITINNTAPSITGVQPAGKTFSGLLGLAVDNLSIAVDASVVNCSLFIGSGGNPQSQVSTVINRDSSTGNCTYQFTQANGFIGMGAFDILWNATDGLDYRTSANSYIVDLQQNKHPGAPTISVAQAVGTQDKNQKDLITITALVVLVFGFAWYFGKK